MNQRHKMTTAALIFLCWLSARILAIEATAEKAQEESVAKEVKMVETTLAKGKVKLLVPGTWKAQKLRSSILEREYTIPPAKGDKTPGRLTMMQSGGSVKANVERWFLQFTQPDNKATKEVAKVTDKKINEQQVTLVDITGTFKDRQGGGPFAGGRTVQRPDYRMLGGIVQTKQGQYFLKLYGPKKTVSAAEKPFLKMMESINSR